MIHLKYFENTNSFFYRNNKTYHKFVKAMNIMNLEDVVDYVIDNCSEWIDNPVKIERMSLYFGDLIRNRLEEKKITIVSFISCFNDILTSAKKYLKRKLFSPSS